MSRRFVNDGTGTKIIEYTDEEKAAKAAAEKEWADGAADRAWKSMREQRDRKLAQSDWMANSDVTMSNEWKTYRQELRDFPSTLNNTTIQGEITWPTEPS